MIFFLKVISFNGWIIDVVQVLGIDKSATANEVKKAYRKLVSCTSKIMF
jgi:preprotein translocase subunit Sec63